MRLPAIARGITLNNHPIGWSPKSSGRFFIYRNYQDSVGKPPMKTETKFHFGWDFAYILHKLVLFHEKSLYLQKKDYQFY